MAAAWTCLSRSLKDQRECTGAHFSGCGPARKLELLARALETLTTQMDAIGASCIEAAKTAHAQGIDSAPLVPASEPPNEDQNSEPTTSSADAPPEMPNVLDPAKWPAAPSAANTERAPATNFQVLSQYMSQ